VGVGVLLATVVPIMIVGKMIEIGSWRKRNAAENFAKARRFDRRETFACGKAGRSQVVGDHDQLIWISALVAAAADGRGDCPARAGV
jgi:hypothetical protein